MPQYVDGFVIPLPKKNVAAYAKMARAAGVIWREHGALAYYECIGEDLAPSFGVPFPKLCKAKSSETVVFSWIVYKSRAHRDRVNKKVMADPGIASLCDSKKMPFDAKRMAWSGFEVLVKK